MFGEVAALAVAGAHGLRADARDDTTWIVQEGGGGTIGQSEPSGAFSVVESEGAAGR